MHVAVNEWLRATKVVDGLIDADAVLRDPGNPSRLRAEFDSGDHLHPNDAGSQAVVDSFSADICGAAPGSGKVRH